MRGYDFLAVARRHSALALLFAGWLLGWALESAPHLVHHLFDEDDGAGCGFLATTHHTPAHPANTHSASRHDSPPSSTRSTHTRGVSPPMNRALIQTADLANPRSAAGNQHGHWFNGPFAQQHRLIQYWLGCKCWSQSHNRE